MTGVVACEHSKYACHNSELNMNGRCTCHAVVATLHFTTHTNTHLGARKLGGDGSRGRG
jgi:hypothetical protein